MKKMMIILGLVIGMNSTAYSMEIALLGGLLSTGSILHVTHEVNESSSEELAKAALLEDAAIFLEEGISSALLNQVFEKIQKEAMEKGIEQPTDFEIAEELLK